MQKVKDHFEVKYITPFLQGLSLIYLSLIKGICFIWTGNKEQLIRNLDKLNTKHDSIKFELKISKTSISFLNTEMYIKNNKPYQNIKKTNQSTELSSDKFKTSEVLKRKDS